MGIIEPRGDERYRQSLARFSEELADRLERQPLHREAAVAPPAPEPSRRLPRRPLAVVLGLAAIVGTGAALLATASFWTAPPGSPPRTPGTIAATSSPETVRAMPVVAAPAPVAAPVAPPVAAPIAPPQTKAAPAPRDLPPPPRDTGRLGTEEVRELQTRLKALGLNPGPIDGVAGPRTVAAVRRFEEANGRTATGSIDRETLRQLRETVVSQRQ